MPNRVQLYNTGNLGGLCDELRGKDDHSFKVDCKIYTSQKPKIAHIANLLDGNRLYLVGNHVSSAAVVPIFRRGNFQFAWAKRLAVKAVLVPNSTEHAIARAQIRLGGRMGSITILHQPNNY